MIPGRGSFYIGPPAVAWRVTRSMRIRGSGLTTRSSRPLAELGRWVANRIDPFKVS